MIIVNGNKFNNYKINVSLDKFSVSKHDGNEVIKRKFKNMLCRDIDTGGAFL